MDGGEAMPVDVAGSFFRAAEAITVVIGPCDIAVSSGSVVYSPGIFIVVWMQLVGVLGVSVLFDLPRMSL